MPLQKHDGRSNYESLGNWVVLKRAFIMIP
jgi:hypothetical protein